MRAEYETRRSEPGVYSALGREFGVSNPQARNICLGLSWKHLK
jgi:hypothetical protein